MHLEREIRSIASFLETFQNDQMAHPGTVWFRGQSNQEWKLLPGLLRHSYQVSESTLLARFRQSAKLLTTHSISNDFDWVFLMQHYGVPTRLLDWTESPLVSLYFAVERFQSDNTDAAIWALWPSVLNRNANIIDRNEEQYIPAFEAEELKPYSIEGLNQGSRIALLPIATIATRNSPRIQAQLGTFTVHHSQRIPIEEVGDRQHVIKYIIPAASKETIHREIRLLGITRFTLFPELASVGAMLKEMLV